MGTLSLITVIIIMNIIINNSDSHKFSDLIMKAKSKFKFHGQKKVNNFLTENYSIYPGTNKTYRHQHEANWNAYYACLEEQHRLLGKYRSISPEARLVYQGNSIKFDCKICLSPTDRENAESIVWVTSRELRVHMEPIIVTEHIVINPRNKSLTLYDVQKEQTGQYSCKLGSALTPIYFLTVVDDNEPTYMVKPLSAPKGHYPAPDMMIPVMNLSLTTKWGPWSPCSKCDHVGKRFRFGICTVMYPITSDLNTNEEEMLNSNIIEELSEVGDKLIKRLYRERRNALSIKNIVRIFQGGIPCRSHILPKILTDERMVKLRASEIMSGFCLVKEKEQNAVINKLEPCPKAEIFEVRNNVGEVIETANNSAGIYSMLQGLPDVEPSVERSVIYADADEPLTITCPGNLNSDIPVQWQVGTKLVIPKLLYEESQGRIYMSMKDHINIKNLVVRDSQIYSCWQHDELAGTIRLVVTKKLKLNFNHHIMLLSIVIIMSTFLLVFGRAIIGRKYARI